MAVEQIATLEPSGELPVQPSEDVLTAMRATMLFDVSLAPQSARTVCEEPVFGVPISETASLIRGDVLALVWTNVDGTSGMVERALGENEVATISGLELDQGQLVVTNLNPEEPVFLCSAE